MEGEKIMANSLEIEPSSLNGIIVGNHHATHQIGTPVHQSLHRKGERRSEIKDHITEVVPGITSQMQNNSAGKQIMVDSDQFARKGIRFRQAPGSAIGALRSPNYGAVSM
jgi:hypothetical protein